MKAAKKKPQTQKKPTQERISKAEFGRRVGVARSTVTEGVQRKRIKVELDGKILWPQAQAQWVANVDISQQRKKEDDSKENEKWQKARTRREIAEADMAELELQKKLGLAVDAEFVKKLIFEKVHVTRDRILATPKRVAPAVVGLTDERKIARVFKEELAKALDSLKFHEFTEA